MTTYGMILPIIISSGRIGDTRICSMVPRSFSLTMLSAVRMAPTIIMMTAMTPGHDEVDALQLGVVPDAALRPGSAAGPASPSRAGASAEAAT